MTHYLLLDTAQSLKHLKGFHVTYHSDAYTQFDPLEDIINLLPPHLTSLTLTSRTHYSQMISSPSSKYFWARLTELNWTIMSIDSVGITLDIISHCRALKSLKFQMHNPYDDSNSSERSTGSIDLYYLTSLSLSVVANAEFTAFFKRLNLPSLRTLHYKLHDVIAEVNSIGLKQLSILMRSCGDTVRLLQLYGAHILDSQDLENLLQFTPRLNDLKLFSERLDHSRWAQMTLPMYIPPYTMGYQDGIGDELLHALSPQDGGGELCPQLETLEFSREMRTGVTEGALKEFMKARKCAHMEDPRIPALRKICIPISSAWKQKETDGPEATEEKVSLGPDSAVYFKKMRTYRPESTLTPYAIKPSNHDSNDYDVYNEL